MPSTSSNPTAVLDYVLFREFNPDHFSFSSPKSSFVNVKFDPASTVVVTSSPTGILLTLPKTTLPPTIDLHQLKLGDYPNVSTFNGKTYPANAWTPFLAGESWGFSGQSQLQGHQFQWSVVNGNWTVQLDLYGNTAINESWPAVQVGFIAIAATRYGGI